MAAKKLTLTACLILLIGYSYAQEEGILFTENLIQTGGGLYFFSALIAGVVIALSIYLLLTSLAAAVGLSAMHPEKIIAPGGRKEQKEEKSSEESGISTARKAVNAMGFGALIVGIISMFIAAWFGVELSRTNDLFVGAIMALSIWAVTYLLLMTLEARLVSSAAGTLYRTAVGGLQAAGKTIGEIFGKSPEDRAAKAAEEVIRTAREEIFGDIDARKLRKEIGRYVQQLKPPTPKEIAKELRDLLDDTELQAVIQGDPVLDYEKIEATLTTKGMSKEAAKSAAGRVRGAIDTIRKEYSEKDKLSATADTAFEMAGKSREQAEEMRGKIEEYLRNTNKEELNPEGIKRDFERLFVSPREGMAALRQRIGSMDKSTVTAILEQRKDMSHDEAEKIVDNIEKILNTIRTQITGKKEAVSESAQETKSRLESKMQNYMDSLGRPELRYQDVKEDVKLLFHDPKAGIDMLVQRLKSMDRETLKAILASKKDISEEDAEQIIQRIESARDEVVAKAERMKEKVQEEVALARQKAADAAAETRKTAATASWWSFLAAVGSAAAAVAGGLIAAA